MKKKTGKQIPDFEAYEVALPDELPSPMPNDSVRQFFKRLLLLKSNGFVGVLRRFVKQPRTFAELTIMPLHHPVETHRAVDVEVHYDKPVNTGSIRPRANGQGKIGKKIGNDNTEGE